jgi:hypothetical protein
LSSDGGQPLKISRARARARHRGQWPLSKFRTRRDAYSVSAVFGTFRESVPALYFRHDT